MKEGRQTGIVREKTQLTADVFSLVIEAESAAAAARPGQFFMVYSRDCSRLLGRPISLCETDRKAGTIRMVFRTVGAGTKEFAGLKEGEEISLMGPLGNGYPLEDPEREGTTLLMGGGIGIPPLVQLAKELPGEKSILVGYRDAQTFLTEELAACGGLRIASEDGSVGTKGNVMDLIRPDETIARIFACGPSPMLKAIQKWALEAGIPAWLSLEERMACGVGACLACTVKTPEIDGHTHVHNKRVCKDGPVIGKEDLAW